MGGMTAPNPLVPPDAAFIAALVAELDRVKSRSSGIGCLSVIVGGRLVAALAWFGLDGSAWLRGLVAVLALPGTFVVSLVVATELDGRSVRDAAARFEAAHPSGSPGRAA